MAQLYDLYGELLTEHQCRCLDLHYLQDYSLGEIAAELCVSRQAVHDILRRAEDSLEHYEKVLRLLAQTQERSEALLRIRCLLTEAESGERLTGERIRQALDDLDRILK